MILLMEGNMINCKASLILNGAILYILGGFFGYWINKFINERRNKIKQKLTEAK